MSELKATFGVLLTSGYLNTRTISQQMTSYEIQLSLKPLARNYLSTPKTMF